MKFNPNFMQLEKWRLSSIRRTQKYAQHFGLWWVIHKHVKLFRVVIEIDQKKQTPWIFYIKKQTAFGKALSTP